MYSKFKAKLLSAILSLSIAGTSVIPASATEYKNEDSFESVEYQNTADEDFSNTTNVFAQLRSIYDVTIPKTVVLSGDTKDARYFVKVKGDIAGYEQIDVLPDESFALFSKNKDSQIANIQQDKTTWTVHDFGTDANGLITAPTITAGSWQGAFNFNILFKENGNIVDNKDLTLDIPTNNLLMSAGDETQVHAFINGKDVTQEAIWESDNENITVDDGFITTSAFAKPGDSANISVSLEEENSLFSFLDKTNILKTAYADEKILSFKVTIVEIKFDDTEGNEIDNLSIIPGNTASIRAKIIPEVEGNVSWSCTMSSGVALKKNGNDLSIKVSSDMPINRTFFVVATYGDYSKTITVNTRALHIEDKEIEENKVEPTCTKDGSVEKVIYCIDGDGYEFKREKEVIPALGHNFDSGIITKNSSCTEEGIKTYTCSRCGEIKTESIEKIKHTPGEFVVVKDSTCTEEGLKEQRCTICNTLLNNSKVELKQHTPKDIVIENKVEASCENAGSYDEVVYCKVCNKELSRKVKVIEPIGHKFSDFTDVNGIQTRTCTVCGKIQENGYTNYTISYNLNGGNASNKTSYNKNTDDFTLVNPTKNYYTFTGWTGSNGTTPQTSVKITKGSTGNKTYTANFTPISYNITYNLDGGTISGQKTSYNVETSDFTLPTPTKVGYTFTGWTGTGVTNSTTSVKVSKGSNGNRIYTANWKINTYTVTCEDWIVDASNNRKTNITNNIPLGADSTYVTRTITVNYGTKINASAWGSKTGRNTYASNYGYVGTSGDVTVTSNTTVYRYFYQTLDVNIILDGTSKGTGKDGEAVIGTFDVYVNNAKVATNASDYCTLQPYGAVVELKNIKANTGYKYIGNATISATMGSSITYLQPSFVKTYEVITSYSEGINKITGAGWYEKGATVTLEAVVQDCATWVNWTGTATNTNKKITFTMPASSVNYKANAKPNTSATTHSWKTTVSQAATCKTDSVESQVCIKCGTTRTTHNTKMTGHTADKTKDVVTKATCTKGGYTTHTCSKCKETFVDTYTNAIGHKYNSEGTCTVCGDFDINKLSPGTYTKKTENGKIKYTLNKTWDSLVSENVLTVDSNGYVKIVGGNTVTGASPNKDKITGLVVLPTTVKKVDGSSFYQCAKITGYYISKNVEFFVDGWSNSVLGEFYVSPENTRFTVENGALYSKDKTILWCSAKSGTGAFNISSNCKTIKSCAFARSGYSTINIPNGVTTLEGGSFRNMSNLKNINIPASLTNLSAAFPCCNNLTAINVNSNNTKYISVDGVVYEQGMKTLVACGAGKTGNLNIPESVVTIAANACDGCSKLTSVNIPNSVTSIGNWAFSGCGALTKLTLPDNPNYVQINTGAFSSIGATEVIIPKNIRIIYRSNFRNKVASVKFADTTKQWKLTLQESNGTAISGVPTNSFAINNNTQNADYFKTYQYYKWTRQ